MRQLDYTQLETVQESPDVNVVRAVRRVDGLHVLLKVVQDGGEEPRRRLLKEREIGKLVDPSTILFPVDLAALDGQPALVLQDFAGHPLEDELGYPMELEAAITLAIRLAGKLGELHARGIVHRDLKPEHVFVDPRSGEVRLTGLGVALTSGGAYRPSNEPGLIEGTFAYMAPEQTGQTGRLVDQRADLYSFGVVLHRMLTGKLPLEAADALGWIHVHVATRPAPITSLVSGVPPIVAAMVDKLLSKDPEERYQTAGGLVADLERCLTSLQAGRAIESFKLGLHDVPDRLRIPLRLYGRNAEIHALRTAVENARAGAGNLILLVGPPGIGKSLLAEGLALGLEGIFLRGKHEELRRDVPYFAVTQALEQLAGRLLTENEEKLATWRETLRAALGTNLSLLCALVPRFALVVGSVAPIEAASATPSPDRFRLFFERLLAEVANAAPPLVLFLDDLQWADPASIGLIEHVLANSTAKHVLTIGSYRREAVTADHPLAGALARLRARGGATEIELPPLSADSISELLVDAFRCTPAEARTLAALLRERAGGNPLFVTDLLRTLHQQGLIRFEHGEGRWHWDIDRIRRVPFTETAAELVLAKIGGVTPSLQEALRVGASLGIEFSAADIGAVVERPIEQVESELIDAGAQGLLIRSGEAFRFPHDRVREAAYSLVPPQERPALHLRIGRMLIARAKDAERADGGFILADQLNRAASLMSGRKERSELAALDLAVGRKAKAASAYASAAQYLAAGLAVLDAKAWEDAYDTAYGIHLERAACELVLGRLEDAEGLLDIALERARTPVDKAAVYALFVDLRMNQGDVGAALKLGLDGIRTCGIDLPARASRAEAAGAIAEVWNLLGSTPIETLAKLPRATDPMARAVSDLEYHLCAPAFFTDPNLLALLVSRGVDLALRWGVSEASPSLVVALGFVLGAFTGRHDDAWRIGRIAYEMAQRPDLSMQKPLVCLVFAALINYWKHHVRTNLPYLEEARAAAYQLGDLTILCYAENHLVTSRLVMGADLAELELESAERTKRVRELGFDEMADLMTSRTLLIQSLRGKTRAPGSFSTAEHDETELLERIDKTRSPLIRCGHYVDKLQAELITGNFDRALTAGRKVAALIDRFTMFPVAGEHAFYFALALASATPPADASVAAGDTAVLDGCREQLRRWAESCPENFAHKHALVLAESARLSGDDLTAMREYERAIRSAQDNGFVQVQAIAYELAARFYRTRGYSQIADLYLREARRCFSLWGATAKVRLLDARGAGSSGQPVATGTVAARPEELDLLTVTRASQALSAELVRARLVERLLDVMLPYSGASRACFVATESDPCVIEMEAPRPASTTRALPEAVVNYVRRTRERVLLDDATLPNPFSSDAYLRANRPRSVLCIPVNRKDRLLGLIYLENDLASGVFTAERVTVLEVLAGQTAISLESASLFADLERENAQRRRAEGSLRESQEQLQAILENMVDAVLVCDLDMRITLVNQAAARLFGFTEHAPFANVGELGSRFRMRDSDGRPIPPADLPLLRALAGEVVRSVDATITDPSERDVELRMSAAPIRNETGHVVGAVAAASDITEKVELDRLREQFLRMAAHELKTPVAVVSGYADMLQARRQQLSSPQQRMIDALVRGVRRIDRIISDLLFMWQLRMGRLAFVGEKLELGELLSRVATRCEPSAESRRVQLSIGPPVVVMGDRALLEQVFTHLIDNALRFSPGGGAVEVHLSTPAPGEAEVSVRDRGIGIPKAKQARLFEPFYRAHAETAHDFGGMGIGLYLSRVIVGRHGGSLTFESRESEGSTFTVRLPSVAPG